MKLALFFALAIVSGPTGLMGANCDCTHFPIQPQACVPPCLNGRWVVSKGGADGGGGGATKFRFQVEGGRLTGALITPLGETPLMGKIDGDKISFRVTGLKDGGPMSYTGVMKGDTIELTAVSGTRAVTQAIILRRETSPQR